MTILIPSNAARCLSCLPPVLPRFVATTWTPRTFRSSHALLCNQERFGRNLFPQLLVAGCAHRPELRLCRSGIGFAISLHMTRDGAKLQRAKLQRTKLSMLPSSTSGAVFAEYLTVFGIASLVIAAALVELGATRTRFYSQQRESLFQPYP